MEIEQDNNVGGYEAIVPRNGISFCEIVKRCDLSEEQLLVLEQCKEEQISDNEFPASSDEVTKEKTWYPSDCVLVECDQGREELSNSKETLMQDNIFADVYKVEHISDEEILASSSDEENDNTCYPSECAVEHWNQMKETRNENKDKSKQGLPVDEIFSDGCKEEHISEAELTEGASDEEHNGRTWYPSEIELDNMKEREEATGNTASCKYCRCCFSKDIILLHETMCGLKLCSKRCEQGEYVSKEEHTGVEVSPHICDICGKGFAGIDSLTRHEQFHNGEGSFLCDVCEKEFARIDDLMRHIRIHTGEKPYSCSICGKGFIRLGSLNTHIRGHTGEKLTKKHSHGQHKQVDTGVVTDLCDKNGKEFPCISYLTQHKRIHTDEILDDVCKEKQISDEEFLASSSDEENNKTCYPSECIVEDWNHGKEERNKSMETLKQGLPVDDIFNDGFKKKLFSDAELTASPSDEENNDRTWYPNETELENLKEREEPTGSAASCKYCKLSFSKKFIVQHEKECNSKTSRKEWYQAEYVSREQQTDCQDSPYIYDRCVKEFNQVACFTLHKPLHTGNTISGREVSEVGSLATHNRNRIKEGPHPCGIRDKRFAHASQLAQHKRIHTGERPYVCDMCRKGFTRVSNLAQHRRIHTGEKPYICDICEKGFTQAAHLTQHKRTHTGEKPYKCYICGKGFARSFQLKKHKRIHTD